MKKSFCDLVYKVLLNKKSFIYCDPKQKYLVLFHSAKLTACMFTAWSTCCIWFVYSPCKIEYFSTLVNISFNIFWNFIFITLRT